MTDTDLKVRVVLSAGVVTGSLQIELGSTSSGSIPLSSKPIVFEQLKIARSSIRPVIPLIVVSDSDSKLKTYLQLKGVNFLESDSSGDFFKSLKIALIWIRQNFPEVNPSLEIVFGDAITLDEMPYNSVGVFHPEDPEDWSTIVINESRINVNRPGIFGEPVIAGTFSFSSYLDFTNCAEKASDFWETLNEYHKNHSPLQLFELCAHFDLGRIDTLYKSRLRGFEARQVNRFSYNNLRNSVTKSSSNAGKIIDEVSWFELLPNSLDVHVPRLLSVDKTRAEYEIEYIPNLTIAESLICGNLSQGYWRRCVIAIDAFILRLHRFQQKGYLRNEIIESRENMYRERILPSIEYAKTIIPNIEKIQFRVDGSQTLDFSTASEIWLNGNLLSLEFVPTLVHGDLFFGNMFFDVKTGIIKVIDPRGKFGVLGNFGDPLYDLAKLSHSVLGGYDLLSAGIFHLEETEDAVNLTTARNECYRHIKPLMIDLLRTRCQGMERSWYELRYLESLLFLFMLPIHSDSLQRQKALLTTSLSILSEAENGLI